jgi:transposase
VQDTKLFETILGLQAPWRITRVDLNTTEERVDLWAEHAETRWPCPECQQDLPCWDHAEERTWRHLDTCQFQTHLHARVPRVNCPTHGVKQVRVSWAEPRSRFTLLMERLVIDVILQCSTLTGACRILRISWDEAWGVMARAVARGQARKAARPYRYLGVDEKAFRKRYRFHTVVCDLERSTVEYVSEDRRVESLAPFFAQLMPEQRASIQAIAMDMWDPYYARHARRLAGRGRPNRLRQVSHHARHERCRRHRAQTGTSRAERDGGRLAADWDEILVAVQRGTPARSARRHL